MFSLPSLSNPQSLCRKKECRSDINLPDSAKGERNSFSKEVADTVSLNSTLAPSYVFRSIQIPSRSNFFLSSSASASEFFHPYFFNPPCFPPKPLRLLRQQKPLHFRVLKISRPTESRCCSPAAMLESRFPHGRGSAHTPPALHCAACRRALLSDHVATFPYGII